MVSHKWIAIPVTVVEAPVTEDFSIVVVVLPAIVGGLLCPTTKADGWVFDTLSGIVRHSLLTTSVEESLLCKAFRIFIL